MVACTGPDEAGRDKYVSNQWHKESLSNESDVILNSEVEGHCNTCQMQREAAVSATSEGWNYDGR